MPDYFTKATNTSHQKTDKRQFKSLRTDCKGILQSIQLELNRETWAEIRSVFVPYMRNSLNIMTTKENWFK